MTTPEELANDIQATFLRLGPGKVISENELEHGFNDLEGAGALRTYLNECGKSLDQLLSSFPERFIRCGPNRWRSCNDGSQKEILDVMAMSSSRKGSKGGRGGGGGFGRGRGAGRGNSFGGVPRTVHPVNSFKHAGAPHRGGIQNSRQPPGGYGAAPRNNQHYHQSPPQPPPSRNDSFNNRPAEPYYPPQPSNSRVSDYSRRDEPNRSYSRVDDRDYNASRGFFDDSVYDNTYRPTQRTPSPPRRPIPPVDSWQHRREQSPPRQYNDYGQNRSGRYSPDRSSFRAPSPGPYSQLPYGQTTSGPAMLSQPPGLLPRGRSPPRTNSNYDDDEAFVRPIRTSRTPSMAHPEPPNISGFSVYSGNSPPPPGLQLRNRVAADNQITDELAQRFGGSFYVGHSSSSAPYATSHSSYSRADSNLTPYLAEKCMEASREFVEERVHMQKFLCSIETLIEKEFPGKTGGDKKESLMKLKQAFPDIMYGLEIEDSYVVIPKRPAHVVNPWPAPPAAVPIPHFLEQHFTNQKPSEEIDRNSVLFQMIRQLIIFMDPEEFNMSEKIDYIVDLAKSTKEDVRKNLTYILFTHYKGKYEYANGGQERVRLSPSSNDRPGAPTFFRAAQLHSIMNFPKYERMRVIITHFTKFDKFSVRLYSESAAFTAMDKSIQNDFGSSNNRSRRVPSYAFKLGHSCIVKKEVHMGLDKFHRAVVIKTDGELRVFLLDIGKVEEPNPDEMYAMPDTYNRTPPFAICCSLNANSRIANALYKRWKAPLQMNNVDAAHIKIIESAFLDSKDFESKVAKVDMFVTSHGREENIVEAEDD